MDNLDVVAQRVENKCSVVTRHVLLAESGLSIVGGASLATRESAPFLEHHLGQGLDLHGSFIPLSNVLLVLAGEGNVHGSHTLLQVTAVLLQAVGAAAAEPEVDIGSLGAEAAVRVRLMGLDHELVAERFEDGLVEVSHLGEVVTDRE